MDCSECYSMCRSEVKHIGNNKGLHECSSLTSSKTQRHTHARTHARTRTHTHTHTHTHTLLTVILSEWRGQERCTIERSFFCALPTLLNGLPGCMLPRDLEPTTIMHSGSPRWVSRPAEAVSRSQDDDEITCASAGTSITTTKTAGLPKSCLQIYSYELVVGPCTGSFDRSSPTRIHALKHRLDRQV